MGGLAHDKEPIAEPAADRPSHPTPISEEKYHDRADHFMDALNERAEKLQETRDDVEVEYSAGVLSITIPSKGTYVINKQPPNKQIWLASPVSGPKRFDWVLEDEGLHQKEGSGKGNWIYIRDGTSLTELLREEVGLKMAIDC
ncbi:Frataxin [Piedraia hortae CBS 480.64]|uniref:ferroxidase n=1 Tax=Piedraia hortae CBS 480.64 TaxID=1314780 RepID=A0A6A7BUE8_9PEZI|nr:Frataxin [Piedraia hortae CBS 480.64]